MAVAFKASGPAKVASMPPIRQRRFGDVSRLYPEKWHPRPERQGRNLKSSLRLNPIPGPHQLVAGLSTADHFSISLFTSAASAACVRASALGISEPRSSRRLRTFSSSSALDAAAFNFARIGAGVPFGPKIAFQAEAW